MRKIYWLFVIGFSTLSMTAQVGIGTSSPNASSALDISSTAKGLLITRMTLAQKTAIASPATGMLVYQTDGAAGFWFYNGAAWMPFASGTGWGLSGNTGTTVATNKLGTTDAQPFVLKTNNTETLKILSNGNIGFGTTNPTAKAQLMSSSMVNFAQDFSAVATGNVTLVSSNNPYSFNTNVSCVAADGWRIDTVDAALAACTVCTGRRAVIDYGASTCDQNATLVVKTGVIPYSEMDIYFSYTFNWGKPGERFTVVLYNETTSSVVSTLIDTTVDATDINYYATKTVTAGNSYSLRFTYIGDYGNGLTVDNIRVGSGVPSLTIQDGNQASGRILLSDASGNGTWTNPSTLALTDDDWRFASGTTVNDPIYRTGRVGVGNSNTPINLLDAEEPTFSTSGTQIGVGNNEYFEDRSSEFTLSHNVVPRVDNSISLGSATLRWSEVYAINGAINTSDAREKESIQPLRYNTNDLMKLKPVSYQWKVEKYGNTIVPEQDKRKKIGFIAQELQEVLPEVVQSKHWKEVNGKYKNIPMERLGVNYAEILPIVIKTTQEQQVIINDLRQEQDKIQSIINELDK